ncbi:penicillin-binding transpeptidase domain-containing protein [Nocardiopsis sp. CC223A]|uniref:penicillin-binding transpeptidase domain-containing protein n=1 Tax=Nocardiopsis sp. CC223A TaxID=3044051 RepID=UPI00278C0BA6|nr:penicillin-binding transpeptidase domain-containing protein [Nocardiopsis sp. CC223A]
MDERSPRQPDSSGPPEESGDTPNPGVRPENPYRIPQRPPASDGAAASGASDRPESWDTPYPAAQGPTGEWTPLRPEEAPPTDTWKGWEAPADTGDTTGARARPGGTAPAWGERPGTAPAGDAWGGNGSGPQPTGAAWNTPGGADASAWGSHSGPQPAPAAWGASGGDADVPAWGEPSVDARGTDGTAWGGQPGDARGSGDARGGSGHDPQRTGATWGEQPDAPYRGADADGRGRGAHSAPQQTAAAWGAPGGDADEPAWDGRSAGTHRSTGPATGDTAWGGNDPEQTTAAWDDRPGTAPPGDTWTGDDRNDTWTGTDHGPQQAGGAWDGRSAGTHRSTGPAMGDTAWGGNDPEQTTAAWDDRPGTAPPGDTWTGDDHGPHGPQQTGGAWDGQPGDTRGTDDSWGAHGGPQQTAAAWSDAGDVDDAPAWDGRPRGADAPRGGAGPRPDDPAGPRYRDEWSGPQQGAGAWDSGDGRGGPPQGPDGPHDDWDDWDGEPQDAEPAPRGDGFEYLYNGNAPAPPEQPDRPVRRSRRGLLIGLVSAFVVLALIGGGVSWYVLTLPRAEEATTEYAAAWEAQDYERLAAVTTGGDPAEVLGGIASGIGVESVDVTVGEPTTDGDTGTASYEVAVGLSNAGDWGWEGELPLVRQDGEWRVDFSPEVAFPGLAEGQALTRTAVWGERGQILAADGTRLDDPSITGSLQMIVGTMGEATEEDVERLGPAYRVGDTVGATGLQYTYEERLAGQAATTIVMVDAGTEADSVEVTEDNTVATLDGAPGENIVTSIDMAVQNAAADAIINAPKEAGMVAIRPSTGEILAAVNVPGGFNRAFEGRYPPGSTFKVVSYNALLDGGLTMDTPFQCPKEYNPGGWEFTNAGGAEYGAQTMTQAFATSCNTALVQAAVDNIDADALLTSAELFGMNAPMDIGVPTFEPVYPITEGAVMLGAQAIGQGQVETSPLHMATVPAAVADGTWRPPLLVTEPAAGDLPEPRPIPNAEALRTMMRAVVTEGTAKDLPFQGEVYGKTGTAEFGTAEEGEELPSHAWMIGFKGDVAFAVVVEGGGGGSSVAGPIAAAFTNAL